MRRNADRFCKLTFWPIVEIEGEIPSWHSCDSNFWCIGDNDDFRDGHELCDVPFSEVLPVHTVFEEPDFSSVWDAREKPGKKLSYWNPLCSCVFLMLNLTAAPNGGSSPMTPTIHLMNVSSHVAL